MTRIQTRGAYILSGLLALAVLLFSKNPALADTPVVTVAYVELGGMSVDEESRLKQIIQKLTSSKKISLRSDIEQSEYCNKKEKIDKSKIGKIMSRLIDEATTEILERFKN
ncbi:MAG: hypothetical protein K8F91_04985 [Candidatus Obscuribacterales bacterium]|nr:hypothetical protein [Candidatus Obscuribacterales bacterium]